MKENQESHVANDGVSPSMRAEDKPMKDAMRKQAPAIALGTVLLASYALVLTSILDLRASMTDLRQDIRAEFRRVDARFERIDARLYELTERVARIEGHLALTGAPSAETTAAPSPAAEQAILSPGV